mgnify:FL=1
MKTIIDTSDELSQAITDLYEEYAQEMGLGQTIWNPELELGVNTSQVRKDYKIAFIESRDVSSHFEISLEFKRQQVMATQQTPQGPTQVPQEQIIFRPMGQGWK